MEPRCRPYPLSLLGRVDFGNWIILFGAAMLLSVLPIIILLNALASARVDDDISQHLGLNSQGSHILDGLFRTSNVTFSLGVLVSLVLSLAGTAAVAKSIQSTYEQTYQLAPSRGISNLVRCLVWIAVAAGVLVADATISKPLDHGSAGPLEVGLAEFAIFTAFFWWTIHFLLAGRKPWGTALIAALSTAVCWIGLGVFASFYFSSTVVSDSRLYGTIGVVFTLMAWFIAIGAVIALGPLIAVVWQMRGDRASRRPTATGSVPRPKDPTST